MTRTLQEPPADAERDRRKNRWFLLAWLVFLTAVNLLWHATHPSPPLRGLESDLALVNQLEDFLRRPVAHLEGLLRIDQPGGIANWYNAGSLLTVCLFGRTEFGVSFISTLFLLLMVIAVYGIVEHLAPGRGPPAAAVAAAFPAAIGWSRILSPPIAMMALTATAVWCLIRSDWYTRALPALALGLLTAFAWRIGQTISDTAQVIAALGPVGVYAFAVAMIRPTRGRLRPLLIAAATLVLIAVVTNYPLAVRAFGYVYDEGVTLSGTRYEPGNVWKHPLALLAYPALLWEDNLGPWLTLATLASLVYLLRRPRAVDGVGIVYFVVPLLVASLTSKKLCTYTYAILPGAAVLVGLAVGRLPKWAAKVAMVVLMLLALWAAFWPGFNGNPERSFPNNWNTAWYNRFFQEIDRRVDRPRTDGCVPCEIARQAVALAEQRGSVSMVVIGHTLFDGRARRFRFSVALANADRRLLVYDPLQEISDYCIGSTEQIRRHPGCPEPELIVVLPYTSEMVDVREFTSDTANWRDAFNAHVDCINPDSPKSRDAAAASERWVQCLGGLPWNRYRRRNFRDGLEPNNTLPGILLDRPDLGVAIELPPRP